MSEGTETCGGATAPAAEAVEATAAVAVAGVGTQTENAGARTTTANGTTLNGSEATTQSVSQAEAGGRAAAGTTAGGTRRESESLDGSVSVSLGEAFCPWKYKIHTTARFEHYNLYCSSGNTGIVSILSTLLLVLVKLLLVSIPCFCSRRSD